MNEKKSSLKKISRSRIDPKKKINQMKHKMQNL